MPRPPVHFFLGAAALVTSHVLLFARVEPVYSYFFSCVWWPYILMLDGLVYWRTGDSLFMNRRREFLVVAFWSVASWNVYECFNFRLQNWYYVLVPEPAWAYRLNYSVAFATVFPCLFETAELLQSFGWLKHWRLRPFSVTRPVLIAVFVSGVLATVLPLIWPLVFFPLIWVTMTLLLEPVLYRFAGRSLLAELERGDPHRLLSLLVAGFISGGLWEFWNSLTRTKWLYTVPGFEEFFLFEMPLLGYLGFPPLAVECYVLYAFLGLFRANRGWEREASRVPSTVSKSLAGAVILGVCMFNFLVFEGITHRTVSSHNVFLSELPDITPDEWQALEQAGLRYPYELVDRVEDQGVQNVAEQVGLPTENMQVLYEASQLIELKGIGVRFFRLLQAAGITTIETLAQQDSKALAATLIPLARELGMRPPYERQVGVWVRAAQRYR